MKIMFDVTVTIIFHREGAFALPALASMEELVSTAREAGIRVEARAVLDNADDLTRRLVASQGAWLDDIEEVSFGDLGLSRNKGAQSAHGKYLAFLDGDDLWGADWLRLAYAVATAPDSPRDAVWHPESLYFFNWNDFDRHSISHQPRQDAQSFHFFHHPSVDSDLMLNTLFLENFWSANVFARRSLHLRHPYKSAEKESGFGIEDWSWNIETVWANIPHRVVSDTVHLIRVKESGSLNQKNDAEGLLPHLPDHAWPKFDTLYEKINHYDVLTVSISERDGQIACLDQTLAEREGQIANLRDEADRIMIEKDWEIRKLRQQLNQILHSRAWRVTAPLRKVMGIIRHGVRVVNDPPVARRDKREIEQSDVVAACPQLRSGRVSAFEQDALQPSDNHQDELITDSGKLEIPTGVALLKASLETPTGVLEPGVVRFSGWCCHPQHCILELSLSVGMESHLCKYGLERLDVAQTFIGWPAAERSGFEVMIPVPLGRHAMRLDALLDSGQMVSIPIESTLAVRSPSIRILTRRKLGKAVRFARFSYASAREWHKARGRLPTLNEIPRLLEKATHMFRQRDVAGSNAMLPPGGFKFPEKEELYFSWLRYNQWNQRRHTELLNRLSRLQCSPLISVVMPVYNPPLEYLEKAIESVIRQAYSNWELCIADDCSTDPAVRNYLESVAATDKRIKLVFLEKNVNISLATNAAAELSSGDFVAFLDNDDELTRDALAEVALYIDSNPDTDYLYSDDDKIDKSGKRFAPQFKPDWSPELLLSYMYCSHLVVVRRSLYQEVGGMRIGFEGSQDYDFALRATERARHIGHIPRVLYHWRVLPGSTAQSGNAKPASLGAGLRAVQEALDRRGVIAKAIQPAWAERDGLGIFAVGFPDDGPSVTVIIPTKNSLEVLKACIDSLRCTTYRNYDVIIIDNESDDPETLNFLAQCGHRVVRIPSPPDGFNYAYINNRAVAETGSDFVLFLNNDTVVKEPQWLSRMVGYAQLPGVGAVGARLLYPDGRIQHAGIVHGYYKGMVGPAHKLLPGWHNGYLSYTAVSRNYLAVTAACLLIQKKLFEDIGGFDEKEFGIAYNDIDLCYRLVDKGYRSVYSAGSELVHYEGHSRGYEDKPAEEAAFKRKYGHLVDPYYNRNLSLEHEQFEILPRASELECPATPIRALMIAFNLNLEGAPFSQYELTVGLKRLGVIDPVVYCPEDGPLRALYEKAGIDVVVRPHPLLGVFNIDSYEVAIRGFAEMIRELSVQLVYGNTLQTFYAIDAAHRLGLPSIWNPRESEPWQTYFANFGDQIAVKALQCFTYPYRIIFVADATRLGCESLNTANNFTTIHNGLDPERADSERAGYTRDRSRDELGVGDDELMVLLLGTVCDRKGQIDLVHAVQKLAESEAMHRLRFFIVGDRKSAYSVRMHQTLDQLPHEVRTRVTVVEETPKTALYLSAADIFVCASRVESYPRVILEAMYYGLAIVTTPVYGIAEQLSNRISALFYSPGDVAQLADHLECLAKDPELRARMSTNACLRLSRLTSFDEMLRQYAEHFEGAYYSVVPTDTAGFDEMQSSASLNR